VRSVLDRIFRDLNRREYDSINRVLERFRLAIYKGMWIQLSSRRCASPRLILVSVGKFLFPMQRSPTVAS
jgi:hypothetical protein